MGPSVSHLHPRPCCPRNTSLWNGGTICIFVVGQEGERHREREGASDRDGEIHHGSGLSDLGTGNGSNDT